MQTEEEIIKFILSRVKIFQRIDCEMTLELIATKSNKSIENIRNIIGKYIEVHNKITISNSSFVFNNN